MAQHTTTRRAPCPRCKRRRQRARSKIPLLNTLCAPVSRWGFTILAIGGLYADMVIPTLIVGGLAAIAWLYA